MGSERRITIIVENLPELVANNLSYSLVQINNKLELGKGCKVAGYNKWGITIRTYIKPGFNITSPG